MGGLLATRDCISRVWPTELMGCGWCRPSCLCPHQEYWCPRDGRPQKSQPDFVAGHPPCGRWGIPQASVPVIAWTGNCGCGGSYDAVCGHRVGLSMQNGATDDPPISISESGTSGCWGDECPEDAPRRASARSPPAGSHSALAQEVLKYSE